ncbi:thioesterase family protein [Halovivax sp.]|uniref:acyl-CoA thioesterase n=1 Tax=Halovivax sp. TaxID=1935978 RepID=UPI0025C1F964|nr:thioesterase family protein [Halovivax sp.]
MDERDAPEAFLEVFENRVRFAETDQQGIVFYGEYVTYQDEAVTAFLREIGYDYDAIRDAAWDIHVVSTELNYRHPARFEDVLVNEVRVARVGESSVEFDYRARRKRDDRPIVDGAVTHVAVDEETGSPIRVPEEFREAVADVRDDSGG